jgi:hypothetical protein
MSIEPSSPCCPCQYSSPSHGWTTAGAADLAIQGDTPRRKRLALREVGSGYSSPSWAVRVMHCSSSNRGRANIRTQPMSGLQHDATELECVAEQVTKAIRNREAPVTEPYVA